jgi:ATP-binding cassette subfamily B protein
MILNKIDSRYHLIPLLQQIYVSWTNLKTGKESLIDVLSILNANQTDTSPAQNLSLKFEHYLDFVDVGFKYKSREVYTHRGLTLRISKGDRLGIIGKTGIGKSTFVDIFMGLLRPTDGKILVDGVLLSPGNMSTWRKKIAHVPQEVFISEATLFENVAFGVPIEKKDMSEVERCLRDAMLFNFIAELPQGLHTCLGDRGVQMSGGQKQRLAIARALYKKSEIIVFDEATSALDSVTESEIIETIRGLSKDITLLLIAHRTSTLKNCNKIFEIINSSQTVLLDQKEFSLRGVV